MIERVAEWRFDAVAEREIARERRLAALLRRTAFGLGLAAFGVCPVSCLSALIIPESDSLFVVRSMATLAIVVAFVAARPAAGRLERSHRHLRDECFPGTEGWPVDLLILQGSAPTGRDQGVVWFEGDRMLFVGRRTSFGLTSDQAGASVRFSDAVAGLRHGITLPLRARTTVGEVRIGFDVLDYRIDQRPHDLYRAIQSWQSTQSEGRGQLPPLTFGPGVPSAAALLTRAFATFALWSMLGAYVVAFAREISPLGAVLAAAVLYVFPAGWGYWPPLLPFHAWRDRRRLEAYNRDQ